MVVILSIPIKVTGYHKGTRKLGFEECAMKMIVWTMPLLAVVAACSQEAADRSATQEQDAAGDLAVPDVRHSVMVEKADASEQPPGIDAGIAPGVAFDFRYRFSLPEARIAAVQEEHATLCGRLGVTRCRVTGLTFNKARNGAVEAMMAFKLDPSLALGFAKDATALVERAEGKLATSEVSGQDVGSGIVADDKNAATLQSELRKAETELKIPGLSKDARERLIERQRDLRAQLVSLEKRRDDRVESLATTPVLFNYEAGDTVLGMDRGTPLRQGLSTGVSSFSAMSGFLALIVGAVAPWALLGLGILWAARRLRTKFVSTPDQS
jgi:hypothetical protein